MLKAEEIYGITIRQMPPEERLRLAALILSDLARKEESTTMQRSALDLLEELPGGRLFKTSAEADEYLQGERDSWDH